MSSKSSSSKPTLLSLFAADRKLETEGAPFEVMPGLIFYVRRSNAPEFDEAFTKHYRPFQPFLQAKIPIPPEQDNVVQARIMADAGVTRWEDPSGLLVIDPAEGAVQYSRDNCERVMAALPDLREALWQFARNAGNYRQAVLEREGNS